ncbi:hypothetical protein [Amnibacterium kyonggiense]
MSDDLVAWLQSPGGARVLQTAIIPALAILVAGVLAALIARSAVRATIRRAERAEAVSTVAGLVAAARATVDAEGDLVSRRRAARLRAEADVRTRLLPLDGAETAADWAAERIDAIEPRVDGSRTEAQLADLRDALVQWVQRPGRAKRVFARAAPAPKPAPAAAPAAAPEPEATPVTAGDDQPGRQQSGDASADPDRSVRPGPRRTAPEPQADDAPDHEPALVGAANSASPAAAAPSVLPPRRRRPRRRRAPPRRPRSTGCPPGSALAPSNGCSRSAAAAARSRRRRRTTTRRSL